MTRVKMARTLSDEARERMRELVPGHIRGGIIRYVEEGHPVGGFLTALFENKLFEAVGRADVMNSKALVHIVLWIYNYAPSNSWGSPEKVEAWQAHNGLAGTETKNEGPRKATARGFTP